MSEETQPNPSFILYYTECDSCGEKHVCPGFYAYKQTDRDPDKENFFLCRDCIKKMLEVTKVTT